MEGMPRGETSVAGDGKDGGGKKRGEGGLVPSMARREVGDRVERACFLGERIIG